MSAFGESMTSSSRAGKPSRPASGRSTGPREAIPNDPADPKLAEFGTRTSEEACRSAGFSYATYVRLKISGVVDRYAGAVCAVCDYPPDSSHALLTRSALRAWAEQRQLSEQRTKPSPDQIQFLKDFDLAYGERRLRFVIDGLSHLYRNAGTEGYPQREEIDTAKGRLGEAVVELGDAMSGTGFDAALNSRFTDCFGTDAIRKFLEKTGFDAHAYANNHRTQLDALETALREHLNARLSGFSADVCTGLLALTESWATPSGGDLLVRYLGFPFWDVLLYPVQAPTAVGSMNHVEVVRLSPRDTHRIRPTGESAQKLRGPLSRSGREQDYLWGRLDTAERMIRMLLPGGAEAEQRRWCDEAFRAILEEDEHVVPNAAPLVQRVRETLGS